MKKLLSNSFRWILALLGIGAVSCDREGNFLRPGRGGDVVCMYGVPTAEYCVKGRVVDELQKPLKDISVTHSGVEEAVTSEDGSFSVNISSFSFGKEKSDTLVLNFHDVDGPDNGGSFEDKSVTVNFMKTKEGDGAWRNGTYEASPIKVEMKKKSN